MKKHLLLVAGLLLALAAPSAAQQLTLQIQDGLVTLDASNVPPRQILAEWARVGGTKVVGAEKIVGSPVTLKLARMPERRALDIILANVAGYMAAERQAAGPAGASAYDRILILASSTAPAQAAAAPRGGANNANPGFAAVGTQRRVPPRPPDMPDTDVNEDVREALEQEQANANQNQPVFTFPSPPNAAPGGTGNAPVFMPLNNGGTSPFGAPQPGVAQPVITLQPNANGQPTIYNFVPNAVNGGTQPTTTGFGIVGSPTPGMVQQPPAPPPPPPGPRPPV